MWGIYYHHHFPLPIVVAHLTFSLAPQAILTVGLATTGPELNEAWLSKSSSVIRSGFARSSPADFGRECMCPH